MGIFADEDLGLADEFEAACADPAGLDCGFTAQREATGYANFGFDPDEAEELRMEEEERIAEVAEDWDDDYDDEDDDFDDFEDDEDDDWDDDFDLDDDYEDEDDDLYGDDYDDDDDDWDDE